MDMHTRPDTGVSMAHEVCHQAAPVAAHTVAIENISRTLERMVDGQSEIVELLKESAAQAERNRAMGASLQELKSNETAILARLSAVETKAEVSSIKLAGFASAASLFGGGAVAAMFKSLGWG